MASRRRGFGRVRRLPSGRYQTGYLGPGLALHNALDAFHTREDAEAWLSRERELTHSDAWRPVQVRAELARRQPVARHTSDPHHRRRAAVYDADAAQVRASRKEAGTGAGLGLVDGELVDPGTGEVHG